MRASKRWLAAMAFVALVGAGAGVAGAHTSVQYKSTASPMYHPPTYKHSSTTLNQSIYEALLVACSSGTWLKYINIENAHGPQFVYQGPNCSTAGPKTYAVALSRSACTAVTAGTWYASCWIHRV